MRLLKYFIWNTAIIGTLILSSIYDFQAMINILGVFFGGEAAMYFLVVTKVISGGKERLEWLQKLKFDWKVPLIELIWVCIAFYFKHPFIGICMFVTTFLYAYLLVETIILEKENKDEVHPVSE